MGASLQQILTAIQLARQRIRWKPGKAERHLLKRIQLGQLPSGTTLGAYESLIRRILDDPIADLYTFTYDQADYPTVVALIGDQHWLVMVDLNGQMETAFPVVRPETYFLDPRYTHWGRLQEYLP